jgi:hypothetical protein
VGLDVVVWQEPGAEDLVTRIAADLPDARVIVAPPGIKDISEAHVRGEDVAALVNRLIREAPPVQSLRQKGPRDRQLAAHQAALPVLAHPDALELVEAELRAQGYGGDPRGPLLGYLAATSRVLAWRRGSILSHLLFVGPSSGGKNAAIQAALRLVPDEAVHVIDAASPRVLIYDDAPLEHRIVVFSEADSLPAGEDNPAASAIRNLLQDGRLHYRVTIRDSTTGSYKVHEVDKPGPTVLITTSTRRLGHQLMTRLFTVEIPDEPAQLRAALAAQAALELDDPPPPNEALIAFQRYLGFLAPIDVVVPFAHSIRVALGDHLPGPRVLRDFPRLLSLIKAAAVLRIAHRSLDARGRLVADVDDFRAVHRLVADSYETSSGASRRIRDTVAAVAELSIAKGPAGTVTVTEVAKRLDVSNPSASRRVHAAVESKWLVNDEPRPSQTAKLRIGEPLPATSSLPTPEAISERYATEASEPSSSVFTFSPDPAASLPSTQDVREQGGRLLPVSPENVQSAGFPEQIPVPIPLNFGIFGDEEEWGTGPA